MPIPSGYRLLTAEDVGKVFGVDLEVYPYYDTDIEIGNESYFVKDQTTELTNFIQASYTFDSGYEAYIRRIEGPMAQIWEMGMGWLAYNPSRVSAGLEVTSFNTNYSWNTWFYVKDMETTIPRGYRLLTEDDVDKVFGVDLESVIYFDTRVSLTGNESYFASDGIETTLIDGLLATHGGGSANIVLQNYGMPMEVWEDSSGWVVSSIDMGTDINTVGSFIEFLEGWNTWLYVRDIGWTDPYYITPSKPKITINCKGKLMTSDLTIVRELWDGSYEEIFNGFTLTLNVAEHMANGSHGDIFHYSIDGGSTWVSLNQEQIIIEGITEIKFNFEFTSGMVNVGTTNGGSEITSVAYGETEVFTLENDTTWYITTASYDFDIQ